MTLVARRRVAALVPWLALAAVTAFAIVQMRARHAAEQGVATAVTEPSMPADAVAPPVTNDVVAAAHAAEAALDAALLDLEAVRAESGRLALEGTTASRRAEAAEALLAAHAARVEALELELVALREAATERPAETPVVAVDPAPDAPDAPDRTEASDALRGWVDDAGADEPVRRQGAAKRAASATAEQIAGLAALRADGADPVALARLAAALPVGDATDALVIDLLLAEQPDFGVASRVVHHLGSQALLRPAVLDALLARTTPGVLKVALGLLSGFEAELGDAERRAELAAALTPRLESADASELHAGARAAGLLRLPGLAPRLAELLAHEKGIVRVVAAHALSLVPDLDAVRAAAEKALPQLLLDTSLSVRTAGALLAEALVGAPLAYDPAAGEAARRDAVDAILDRLN